MRKQLRLHLAALALAATAVAAPITFDFKDPKGVNGIQFSLDSLLEPISGTAGGVTGSVSFDPAKPGATTGRIAVAAKTLVVPNATMTEHLHGDGWLNVAKHPEIVFELTRLDVTKTVGNVTTGTASGRFTLKGVTREIKVPVTLTYLAGAFGKRINKPEIKGDLLVLRGEFTLLRADYGIQPGQNEDKVNPEVKITLAVVGSAPKA